MLELGPKNLDAWSRSLKFEFRLHRPAKNPDTTCNPVAGIMLREETQPIGDRQTAWRCGTRRNVEALRFISETWRIPRSERNPRLGKPCWAGTSQWRASGTTGWKTYGIPPPAAWSGRISSALSPANIITRGCCGRFDGNLFDKSKITRRVFTFRTASCLFDTGCCFKGGLSQWYSDSCAGQIKN